MSTATLTPLIETDELSRESSLDISDVDLRRAAQITTVINGIAGGMTIESACERAGVSTSTWHRWRKDGDVQALLQTKFEDVTAGVRDLVAESLVPSTRVLTSLAKGEIPSGTSINGVLAPRDVIAAQQQLMGLWKVLGGGEDEHAKENARVLEELKRRAVSITTVHVDTVNVGSEAQPLPVPSGVRVIDVVPEVLEDGC
ncbi:MAG: hypothetical protein GWN58_27685 [Anaerolineae bacterium]|nr:hypothetical protein [Anaerolineae bacterium]